MTEQDFLRLLRASRSPKKWGCPFQEKLDLLPHLYGLDENNTKYPTALTRIFFIYQVAAPHPYNQPISQQQQLKVEILCFGS